MSEEIEYDEISQLLPHSKVSAGRGKRNLPTCIPWIIAGLIGSCLAIVIVIKSTSHLSSSNKLKIVTYDYNKVQKLDSTPTDWTYYKHTVSIDEGKFYKVSEFVSNYITGIKEIANLGCSTTKVVGQLISPANDVSYYGFDEIHWVDSSVFEVVGPSIANWSDYVESLGMDDFNIFMHNKVQLFVPNLSMHFNKIFNNTAVRALFRLSTSKNGDTLDTAHILMYLPHSGHFYEIVGPSSSLSDADLEVFDEWSLYECPNSHVLVQSIDTYTDLYETSSQNQPTNLMWEKNKDLLMPMAVGISIPTSSLDAIDDTLAIMSAITNVAITTTIESTKSGDYGCTYVDISLNSPTHFEPNVRYVINDAASEEVIKKLSYWEESISSSHTALVDEDAKYIGWDRYLDTHIGKHRKASAADSIIQCR
jgi:hypothetical protein